MQDQIREMLKKDILIAGKLIEKDGYIMFERVPFEQIEQLSENEMAFATHSMGRAIFCIGDNGQLINYKGVNSNLDNMSELSIKDLVQAKNAKIANPYNDKYSINLMITPNRQIQVRINGASPLEDIEIEADINQKLNSFGIKVPQISEIKEFTNEISKQLGLPIKIPGSFDEFVSDYQDTNSEIKDNLHKNMGENYFEDTPEGFRPERMSEYLERLGVLNSETLINFASKYNKTIDDFVSAVDESYSLGQRYGQATRIIESPFRIADLEYYVKIGDIDSINCIVQFTQSRQSGEKRFENVFASQMGANCANLMNAGWICENFVHRQDYTLAGEMCDDSYYCLLERLEHDKENGKWDQGKYEAIKGDKEKLFFSQIHLLSSTVKVLMDEMKLRGISEQEIQQVLENFTQSYADTIDINKVAESLNISVVEVQKKFQNYLGYPQDYVKNMSRESRPIEEYPEGFKYDEDILNAHQGNNVFYNQLSDSLAQKLHIDRSIIPVLQSAIQATTEVTNETMINTQLTQMVAEVNQPNKEVQQEVE